MSLTSSSRNRSRRPFLHEQCVSISAENGQRAVFVEMEPYPGRNVAGMNASVCHLERSLRSTDERVDSTCEAAFIDFNIEDDDATFAQL